MIASCSCPIRLFWSLAFLVSASLGAWAADAPLAVDFTHDIQPILSKNCYPCHGPDKQEAQFRLDSKEGALAGGELGPAIVPGKSGESLLIQAVSGTKPDLVMPKKGSRLTPDQIALLRAWIDQGPTWPASLASAPDDRRNHWAFKAPVRPAVPVPHRKGWARNPIDDFVLARLEKENLSPSPEADKITLIRRLSLDLVGLPPTVDEVQEFVHDSRPGAYERLVERLLASPHYGECWGRHWLDAARYADTNGYEKDRPRPIWPYRDWVINAFNQDMSFDEFTIEQLAGDLLPHPTLEQRVATGFLRNSMLNQEGGIEPEQFRFEAMVDRMDTLGKSLLGLTINCCQCHNHKYDPFSQREYYQLFAFLNNDDEAFMEVPSAKQQQQRDEILAKVRTFLDHAMAQSTNLAEKMAAWENGLGDAPVKWTVLNPFQWQNFATKYEKQDDLSLLGGGDIAPGGTMHVFVETPMTNIAAIRLEALTNDNLVFNGPGLVGKGSFLVKEFEVEASALENPTVTNRVKFRRAVADMEAPGYSITNAIDGKTEGGGWCPSFTPDHRNQNHQAVFECEEPVGFSGGTRLEFIIHQPYDDKSKLDCHMLGSFRLSATTNLSSLRADPLSPEFQKALAIAPADRSPEQKRAVFDIFRLSDPEFTSLNKEIEDAFTNWPSAPLTLVLHARPQPRLTHIFKRGDRLRPTDEVQMDVPSVLNPFPAGAPRNRLGLARWIVDPHNTTTARVIVNRMWMAYFGQGLVTTPEDFGTRVEMPTYPELLDWLACEFRDGEDLSGAPQKAPFSPPWSIKHIHRLIVNSSTYRQSSRTTPALLAKDPYNRLLARGARLRVDGEVVQDIALSASGLLNPKIGGPSVYPPIPASVGDTSYGGFSWPESKGQDRYRRGLYTFWKRSLPFPALTAFDTPSGETSCPRRNRSDTPLQALTTLNEKTFVEAAQAMALRVMKHGRPDARARATYAFELCTARKPTAFELDHLLQFWREQYDYFENRSAAAVEVAIPVVTNLPPDVNFHKLAAWAMVSRAILNLDETITKE